MLLDMAVNLLGALFPNTFKCSSHCLPTFRCHLRHLYFSLELLAYRTCSRLLLLMLYINYLLSYLLYIGLLYVWCELSLVVCLIG